MASLKIAVTSSDHIEGNEKAPIIFLEYGDYQCPFCGEAYGVIKELQAKFKEQLQFVFRNFPLVEIHPLAKIAAQTAEFAAEYGKFWQMHDLIYENQDNLSLPFLIELNKELKLPLNEYEVALETEKFESKIKEDFLGGVRSGVNGTPTFFINGQRYNGAYQFEDLAAAINQAK